jgi:hypothetical protein
MRAGRPVHVLEQALLASHGDLVVLHLHDVPGDVSGLDHGLLLGEAAIRGVLQHRDTLFLGIRGEIGFAERILNRTAETDDRQVARLSRRKAGRRHDAGSKKRLHIFMHDLVPLFSLLIVRMA